MLVFEVVFDKEDEVGPSFVDATAHQRCAVNKFLQRSFIPTKNAPDDVQFVAGRAQQKDDEKHKSRGGSQCASREVECDLFRDAASPDAHVRKQWRSARGHWELGGLCRVWRG